MWGYIDFCERCGLKVKVPSLYVRVYRKAKEVNENGRRSLIICEGISASGEKINLLKQFPHYMWGYIAVYLDPWRLGRVPSLYVRVYRLYKRQGKTGICSLIICEGISQVLWDLEIYLTFPHYMWGYIIQKRRDFGGRRVPSLYVRVYRAYLYMTYNKKCSLIICEGISPWQPWCTAGFGFPHYMWGYIAGWTARSD